MPRRLALSLIFMASRLGTPPAEAATFDFYIGPSGSDSNDGLTTSTPWAITAINTKAATYAGLRVGLLDGTYRITSGGDDSYLLGMPSTASGTSGSHTVIQAVNPRLAVITTNDGAGNYPQGSGGIGAIDTIRIDANYVDFVDLTMGPTGGHGFTLLDAHDVLFEGCWLKDMYAKRKTSVTDDNMGAIFFRTQGTPKSNVTVRNCLIEDIYSLSLVISMNNSNGVGDLFGVSGLLVENCTFKRMGVPMFYKGQNKNIVFRYNFIRECSGFTQAWSTMNTGNGPCTNEVYGNCARVNWGFGANSSNTQGDACTVANFYNNTVIMDEIEGGNACDFGYMVMMGGATAQSLNFYNNAIFLNAGFGLGPGMIRFPTSTEALSTRIDIWNYNRYGGQFNIEDNVGSASYNTLASWQATGRDTNSPAVGVLGLVNQAGTTPDDFRPDTGSALLSAGTVDGAGGAACDIGWTRYATVGHDW